MKKCSNVKVLFVFLELLTVISFPRAASAEEALAVVTTEIGSEDAVAAAQGQEGPPADIKELSLPSEAPSVLASPEELDLSDQAIKEINQTLRRSIEENKRMFDERAALEADIKRIRGELEIMITRIKTLTAQRDDLTVKNEKIVGFQQQQTEELEKIKSDLAKKEEEYGKRLEELEAEAAKKRQMEELAPWLSSAVGEGAPKADTPPEKLNQENMKLKVDSARLIQKTKADLSGLETNLGKVSNRISQLKQENKSLKVESAKQHYNMGNLLFEQRKYKEASYEYQRVVELIPGDPSAHYNLAFVSGEYLKDYPAALEHYERYLVLNPNAEDANLVKEKILEAHLQIGSSIGPPLDKKVNGRPKKKKDSKL